MPKCSQCDTPAFYEVRGQHLCLRCAEIHDRLHRNDLNALASVYNLLAGHFEAQTGIRQPKIQLPSLATPAGNVTLNNLTIKDSQVGVLNTGTVKSLQNSLVQIQVKGDVQTAKQVAELVQMVMTEAKLNSEEKREIVEGIAFLSEQAVAPAHEQKTTVAKVVAARVGLLLGVVANLAQIWAAILETWKF